MGEERERERRSNSETRKRTTNDTERERERERERDQVAGCWAILLIHSFACLLSLFLPVSQKRNKRKKERETGTFSFFLSFFLLFPAQILRRRSRQEGVTL